MARRGQEVEGLAGIEGGLPLAPPMQELEADTAELPLQVAQERDGVGGQDPVATGDVGAVDLDPVGHGSGSPRRTVASMRPCGSVVAM